MRGKSLTCRKLIKASRLYDRSSPGSQTENSNRFAARKSETCRASERPGRLLYGGQGLK